MAAALARHIGGDRVEVHSAGTDPGHGLNPLSVQALGEIGAGLEGETPKPVEPEQLKRVDLVVTLGREAQLDSGDTEQRNWATDEPSLRGIEGLERMRLVRDDIDTRMRQLLGELLPATAG